MRFEKSYFAIPKKKISPETFNVSGLIAKEIHQLLNEINHLGRLLSRIHSYGVLRFLE